MVTIPTNAPVVLALSGQGGGWGQAIGNLGLSSGIADVQTAIASSLRGYGFAVVDLNLHADNIIPAVTWPWSGAATIRPSYETDTEQLAAQVAQAIHDATGYAADVGITAIGAPADLDKTPEHSQMPVWLQNFLDLVERDATWIAVGGVGLVALIVVAVAYGPNIKKLASVNL